METVPLIDCSTIEGDLRDVQDTEGFREFSNSFCNGIKEVGFVYLVNHGVPDTTVRIFIQILI